MHVYTTAVVVGVVATFGWGAAVRGGGGGGGRGRDASNGRGDQRTAPETVVLDTSVHATSAKTALQSMLDGLPDHELSSLGQRYDAAHQHSEAFAVYTTMLARQRSGDNTIVGSSSIPEEDLLNKAAGMARKSRQHDAGRC